MKGQTGFRLIIITILLAVMLNAVPLNKAEGSFTSYEIFNLQIHLPVGARVDYLRFYYYDKSVDYEQNAWITIYDGNGNTNDLINVSSTGSSGYDYTVSDYVGHIVNNYEETYVLNWRPRLFGSTMRLCGMRVAYRLDLGGGTWSSFYYKFVTGATFTPRNSNIEWGYAGAGCIYARDWSNYLPIINK